MNRIISELGSYGFDDERPKRKILITKYEEFKNKTLNKLLVENLKYQHNLLKKSFICDFSENENKTQYANQFLKMHKWQYNSMLIFLGQVCSKTTEYLRKEIIRSILKKNLNEDLINEIFKY